MASFNPSQPYASVTTDAGLIYYYQGGTYYQSYNLQPLAAPPAPIDFTSPLSQDLIFSTVPVTSAVNLSPSTASNVTSINVPPGTWDLDYKVNYGFAAATVTLAAEGASLVSATLPTQAGGNGLGPDSLSGQLVNAIVLTGMFSQTGTTVQLIATTVPYTTVYLVALCAFSLGAVSAYGTLRARQCH